VSSILRITFCLVTAAAAAVFTQPASAQRALATERMVFPDQGWSSQDRLRYYFTSQGSAAMRYGVYANLEVADSQTLFASPAVSAGYGLIPFRADPVYNPAGLPIGLARTVIDEGRWKGEWVGLTCAACHDTELQYKGTTVKISGGSNNHFDIQAYLAGLNAALKATIEDPAKFDRLAVRMGKQDDAGRAELIGQVQADFAAVNEYTEVLSRTAVAAGPGRVDALGLIHNQVVSRWLDVPQNWNAPLAPTKSSYVWNVPQAAWSQWSGVLSDPLMRNLGESLGVFARMDLTSASPEEGLFDSTVDLRGQIEIEELLRRLAPPQWPEEAFGRIDRAKAARGKTLFAENCSSCHSSYPHRWSEPRKQGKRFIENAIIMQDVIGTDPNQFSSPQFDVRPNLFTGSMSNLLPPPLTGAALASQPAIFRTLSLGVYGPAMARANFTEQETIDAHGFGNFEPEPLEPIPVFGGYKANPIEGMWSTPPFLHNGSVPNLYELLMPAAQRSATFLIGSEFDPVKVGVDTSGQSGRWLFDTRLIGNSNAGHSFENGPRGKGVIGRLLTDEERWALIEYVKSVPDAPAQIAPFGGPANPVRAWADPNFYHVRNPGTFNGAPEILPPRAKPAPAGSAREQERIEPDEEASTKAILDASIQRLRSQFPEGKRPVMRDAHPKAHGLVSAQFIVLDDLPEELRHGIFSEPRTYDALIRVSAGNVEVQPDTVPQAGGMAIKLIGVEGEKLLPSERDAVTQDFIMINAPAFFVRTLKDYVELHEFLGRGQLEQFFATRPEETAAIVDIRGRQPFNPIQVRYWSMTPYLLGDRAIKFSAIPIGRTANLPPENPGPDFMRELMKAQLASEDVWYEFAVQLQGDPATMPIEDPVKVWDETAAPFQRVALIRIPRQDIDAPGRVELAENLSFTPWHSIEAHRPLGAINRSRKAVYEGIAAFRHQANGVKHTEPTKLPF
jgi:hypothetical protein